MSAPRIAIVGARRARQGLGPFIARSLRAAGAELVGILGTSEASNAVALADLQRYAGVRPPAVIDLDALAATEPDVLAILSPALTHAAYLDAALARGWHVLCEKPLIWGPGNLATATAEMVERFTEQGLLLFENCQWPQVVPAFEALHGPIERLESFAMRLTPASRGAQMLGDALPHPLSLLQALAPNPAASLGGFEFSTRDPETEELVLEARYGPPGAPIPVRVELRRGATLPREASVTFNGRLARRRVRLEDYAQYLGDGEREVPLPDPLEGHLRVFLQDLEAVRRAARPDLGRYHQPITQRAAMLQAALDAFREHH